jgi:hypothetical protein
MHGCAVKRSQGCAHTHLQRGGQVGQLRSVQLLDARRAADAADVQHVRQQRAHVQRLAPHRALCEADISSRLDDFKVQDVGDGAQHEAAAGAHDAEQVGRLRVRRDARARQQQLRCAAHAVHGRAQLVAAGARATCKGGTCIRRPPHWTLYTCTRMQHVCSTRMQHAHLVDSRKQRSSSSRFFSAVTSRATRYTNWPASRRVAPQSAPNDPRAAPHMVF